jgi:ABC-type enterobactin transport system permease subunit
MLRSLIAALLASALPAAVTATPGPDVVKFLALSAPRIALEHVNVIEAPVRRRARIRRSSW